MSELPEEEAKIQQLTEQEEWIDFKTIKGDNAWNNALKEVAELNGLNETKYRAVFVNGFLTHIIPFRQLDLGNF